MVASSTMINSYAPSAKYCRTSMPISTAAKAHAGMPKKNGARGFCTTNTTKSASSILLIEYSPTSSPEATMPEMTAMSTSINANLARPIWFSTCLPKYQNRAIEITFHSALLPARSLVMGQVSRRHSCPWRTSLGFKKVCSSSVLSMAHTKMEMTHSAVTSTVVVTSMVPTRNHGSE